MTLLCNPRGRARLGRPCRCNLAAIFAGVLLLTAVAAVLVVRPVQGTARG